MARTRTAVPEEAAFGAAAERQAEHRQTYDRGETLFHRHNLADRCVPCESRAVREPPARAPCASAAGALNLQVEAGLENDVVVGIDHRH